jgi:hypothetical protein
MQPSNVILIGKHPIEWAESGDDVYRKHFTTYLLFDGLFIEELFEMLPPTPPSQP